MKPIFSLTHFQTLPILNCTLYRGGKFYATDLESSIECALDVPGMPDDTLIPRKWLSVMYAQNKHLTYSDGKINGVAIPHEFDAKDFPFSNHFWVKFAAQSRISIMAADLRGVMKASANQDIRYYLNGVCADFKNGRVAATDGHRLHIQNGLDTKGMEGQVIIPTGALAFAMKAAGKDSIIQIEHDPVNLPEYARLTIDSTVIHCKLIDGKFPDIDRVIPNYASGGPWMRVNREQGTKDIKQYISLAKATGTSSEPRGCAFKHLQLNGSVSLTTEAVRLQDIETIPCNAAYIIDALAFLDEETSTFYARDANSAIEAFTTNRVAIVMPMRL